MQSHLKQKDGDEFGGWDIRVLQHIDAQLRVYQHLEGRGTLLYICNQSARIELIPERTMISRIVYAAESQSTPAKSLSASTVMSPEIMALVVAIAWMIFPAMPLASKRDYTKNKASRKRQSVFKIKYLAAYWGPDAEH